MFSDAERSCVAAGLGERQLALASASLVFHEGAPRLRDSIILGCLSEDNAGALIFAMAFAQIVRNLEASDEDNACVQALLEPAVAALSNPSPTEQEGLAIFAFFFGIVACGLEAPDIPTDLSGG